MTTPNEAAPKKTKGRQKASMVKISNPSNLQVTFSKRRAGLFKKASELCTLSGAEGALIVFSPANKVYCFGHPNVQNVIGRFSDDNATNQLDPIVEAHRNSTIRELNSDLTQLESMLKAEKRRAQELDLIRKVGRLQKWLPISLNEMNLAQLNELKESILQFQKDFDAKVQKEMFRIANSNIQHPYYPPPPPPPPHHHQENPSSGFTGFPLDVNSFSSLGAFGANDISHFALGDSIGKGNLFAPGGSSGPFVHQFPNGGGIPALEYDPTAGVFPVSGINVSSFSQFQFDPQNNENNGFSMLGGFNMGYDSRMF